eukprot:scaffold502_cov350-Pavlova_lutheri.AAC.22
MGPFLGHVSTRPTRHRASVLERATIPPSLRHQGGHLTTKHPRVVLLTIAKDRLGCFVVPTQVGWWDRGIPSISWTRASVWNRCTCRKEEKKASGACTSRSHRQGRKDAFDRGEHDPHEDDGSVRDASFSTFADAFASRHGLQGRQSARFGRRRVVGTMERLGDGLGDGQVRWNGVFARPNIGQERTDGKRGQNLAQMPLVFGSVETHAVASGRSRGVRARPGSSSWIVQIHRVQSRARPLGFARQAGSHRHGFLNRISIRSSLHGLSRRRVGVRIHDAVHVRIPFPSDPPFRVGSVLLVRWIAIPVSFHAPSTSASTAWHRVDRRFCRLDPGWKRGVPSRKAPSPVVPGTRRLPRDAWDGMGWNWMGKDGQGWVKMGKDGMGWVRMGKDGMGWNGMGKDGMGWNGMEWDGMGWDRWVRMGKDGMEWVG